MPNNGLVFSAKALVFSVSSSCSASGSGDGDLTKGHSGQLVTGYAPDSVNVVPGITLNVSSSFDGTSGTWSASYNGPGGTYSAGGAAFMTPVKIEARMKGVKLYCKLTGSLWRLTWTGIDLYVNGSIVQTDWGGSGDELSDGTGPNYVPIIGLPGSPSGSVSAGRANVPAFVYDPCDPSSTAAIAWTASATNTLVGGWQIQEADDSLTALSLRPYSHSAPSGTGCPYGLNLDGIVTADSTLATVTITTASTYQHEYVGREAETVTVTRYCLDARGERILATAYSADGPARCIDPCTGVLADGYRDVYKTTTTGSGQNGTVVTLPNLEKAIVRLEPDYRAMWLRASVFPSVTASVSRSCVDGAVTSDNSSTPTVYAEENVLLSVVGDSTHAIEDVFGVPTYAPCTATRSQSESVVFDMRQPSTCLEPPDWFDPPACADPEFGFETDQVTHWPASHDNHAKSESVGLTFPSAVGSGGGYQSHNNALARYCASWGAPHWHFGYFPGRYTVEGEVQNGYYVDGTFAPWASYGGKIGEQWLYDSSLPTGEKRRTRNSIVASPLEDDNGNTPFLDTYFGGLRWIGVSRFAVDETTVPSSWTATQSVHGSWNATGASLSFGASYISVGSFTEPQAVVDFALGSLSVKPYELLRLAKQVVVGWESGNVSAVKVVLVGLDGSETTLGTSGGTYDVVAGKSRKYAGSWGIQNGTGGVDDEGTDTGGRGISAASMSDPDRATAFQLSTGRDYRTLRFYVTPVSTSSSVSLHYPTVNLWATHPVIVRESSKCDSYLWADGPYVRRGNWQFWDGSAFNDPPLTAGLGTVPTMVDWLGFKHRVLLGDGGSDLAATIVSDAGAWFDSYEGSGPVGVLDKFGRGFLLPKGTGEKWRAAMVNSFREVPPMPMFPVRKRNSGTWLPTGDYAQVVYDLCFEKRPLVSPGTVGAKITQPDGTEVGTAGSAPSGWSVWRFSPVLDNTETGWKVMKGSVALALVRPWHGWLLDGDGSGPGASRGYDVALSFRHLRASIASNGHIIVGLADGPSGPWTEKDTGIVANWVRCRWVKFGAVKRLHLFYGDGTTSYMVSTADEGNSWGSSVSVGEGVMGDFDADPHGTDWLFETRAAGSGYDVYGKVLDAQGNTVRDWTATSVTGIDSESIATKVSFDHGKRIINLFYESGGSRHVVSSTDGLNFS